MEKLKNLLFNRYRKQILFFLDQSLLTIGIVSIATVFFEYFLIPPRWLDEFFLKISSYLLIAFVVQELLRWLYCRSYMYFLKSRIFETAIALLAVVQLLFTTQLQEFLIGIGAPIEIGDLTLIYLGLSQSPILIGFLFSSINNQAWVKKLSLSSPQIFTISFFIPILIGTLLLKLPKSTVEDITWVDAFFTATSAICVTGLTTLNISKEFTDLGLFVICVLFQIGGLGIMTLTIAFASMLGGRGLGVGDRLLLSDLFDVGKIGEVKSLLRRIAFFTFTIEGIGALLLYKFHYQGQGFHLRSFMESVFHSISAFCNAGFSVYEKGMNTDLIRNNYPYTFVLMVLIVLGGLGFPVLANFLDVLRNRFKRDRAFRVLSTHSKLVLLSTGIFLIGGWLALFLMESPSSFAEMPWWDRLYHSLFLSVTSRTAGFNIWPTEFLSIGSVGVLLFLMWVGASPMSTGGGVKNVTFLIALLNLYTHIRGYNRINIFERSIGSKSIYRAFAALVVSLIFIGLSVMTMLLLEPDLPAIDLIFEVYSAWGTVGLSRGLTADLGSPAKLLLIVLMFVGRVGAITVLGAFIARAKKRRFQYLEDNVLIY